MSHIHTEPNQHDLTIGAYIVRMFNGQPKVFLHTHLKKQRLLPIGGHVELDETPWAGAAREIKEESGYSLDELEILQPQDRIKKLSYVTLHPIPLLLSNQRPSDDHNHTDIGYAFIASDDPKGVPADDESSDFRWLTKAELKKLGDKEIFENTREIYLYILDACLESWEKVSPSEYI